MEKSLTIAYSTNKVDGKYELHLRKTCDIKNLEILVYVNHGEFSLTEIYNKALVEAKNDIVVLLHHDLILKTPAWGKKILNHFNNTEYGILGVAGTTDILPESDGTWWKIQNRMVGQVGHTHEDKQWINKYSNNFGKEIIDVVMIDGLFMAVHRKRIVEPFDETYTNFHFYDLTYCLKNFKQGVKIGVIFDIGITHLSVGQTNEHWESNKQQFIMDFWNELPVTTAPIAIKYYDKPVKLVKNYNRKISIIIPTKSKNDLLFKTIESIIEKTGYKNYEIIIADTGSSKDEIKEINKFIKDNIIYTDITLVQYTYYNFAKINNSVVRYHVSKDSELIIFCNNDIKLLNDAISKMLNVYIENKGHIGTIGCRLHYADNSVQHSGVVAYYSQSKQNLFLSHHGLKSYYTYYEGIKTDILGNTGAFMMMNKNLFDSVNGFNEEYLECFEDVELNLNLILKGRKNYFVGDAVAYHYESQTRAQSADKNQRETEDYSKRIIPFFQQHIQELQKYFIVIQ